MKKKKKKKKKKNTVWGAKASYFGNSRARSEGVIQHNVCACQKNKNKNSSFPMV